MLMDFDSRQAQTLEVFRTLWGEDFVYSFKENAINLQRLESFSDGKLNNWLSDIFSQEQTDLKTNSIIYHGIDLIPLDKTLNFLDEWKADLKNRSIVGVPEINVTLTQVSMLTPPPQLIARCDFVMAHGTLHHTRSVEQALQATLTCLRSGGYYLGWIINEQKPLRKITDEFFRGYFSGFDNISNCESELQTLSEIFSAMGKSMGDAEIEINDDVTFLGLERGKYRLQTLLYDHFLKCYSVEGESDRQRIHQLFDWFNPHYYHQTSRSQLESILGRCEDANIVDIVTKTNGHFFLLKKN